MPSMPMLSRRRLGLLLGGAALASRAVPARAAIAAEKTVKVGQGLYELVVGTADDLLYVAAAGARGASQGRVYGLDLRTLEQRRVIELGADAAYGLAVNNRTGILLGTDARNGKLLVIDPRAGAVKATVAEGEGAHPREVVVDEANNRAFVTSFGVRERPSAIWTVDLASNTVASVVTEGLDGGITGLAFDPAGNRLFTTALQANQVVEVSLASGKVARRFASGGEGAVNLAFDAASGRLYCCNQKSGQLAVLDAGSGQVATVLDTGAGALGVALSADGGRAFVANRGAGTVSVVDTRDFRVLASLATGTHPNTVAVDRRSGLAYVTNKANNGPRGAPPVEDPRGDTVSVIGG